MDGALLCFRGSLEGAKPPLSIQRFIWDGNSLISVTLLITLLPALLPLAIQIGGVSLSARFYYSGCS